MIRIVLNGAAGRMGRAVEDAAAGRSDVAIAARVDRPGAASGGAGWTHDLAGAVTAGTVVVDFSGPDGAREAASVCAARGVPLVTGTTGLAPGDEAALRAAARAVPVLRSANFSLGVAALRAALRTALAGVPADWDVEIVERHHRLKKDSPSGTALALADDVLAARGLTRAALRHGREGALGERPRAEVGMHSLRGGTWVGEHEVVLAGDGEWLELRHVAQSRAPFALGALAAARFVSAAAPGWYTLDDVLSAPGAHRT